MTIRLTYNSINVDGITLGEAGPGYVYEHQSSMNRSGSGKVEVISQYGIWKMSFVGYFNQATYHELLGWFAWASQGQTFSFALDSSNVSSTTLDDTAAAAQAVIPLTATTGLSAGDYCFIKKADNTFFEGVEIFSVSAGVSVTATANLNGSYSSGDTFRHLDYYPSLINVGNQFQPQSFGLLDPTDIFYYRYSFDFEEAP